MVLGIVCFYVTYVSYRNLKSFLPFIREVKYDRELHLMDRALMFGHEPGNVMHELLGTGVSAHVLSYIYLWFLPLVPLAVTAWLVWSRNLSYGYWFVTGQVLAWTLGTVSYYMLPTLGPGFYVAWVYEDVIDAGTPTSRLMDSLSIARERVIQEGVEGAVQSTAGFASLHVAITLLVALMIQYTLNSRILHWVGWTNFALTDRGHHLLRLALHRRRRRRHPDRAALLLRRRPRQRAEVRAARAGVAPDDHHLGRPRRRRRLTPPGLRRPTPIVGRRTAARELQPCSLSRRHAWG